MYVGTDAIVLQMHGDVEELYQESNLNIIYLNCNANFEGNTNKFQDSHLRRSWDIKEKLIVNFDAL